MNKVNHVALRKAFQRSINLDFSSKRWSAPEVNGPVVVGVVHPPDVLGQPVHIGPGVTGLHHRSELTDQ